MDKANEEKENKGDYGLFLFDILFILRFIYLLIYLFWVEFVCFLIKFNFKKPREKNHCIVYGM